MRHGTHIIILSYIFPEISISFTMKHIRGEPRQNMFAHWEELNPDWNL